MESPLDSETVKQILQLGGEKLLGDLADIFREHAPLRMRELRAGLDEGDMVRAAKAAHSFRSSSISLGARKVSDKAAALERSADEGDEAQVREGLPEFESSLESLLGYLSSEYGSHS